ncbi:DUF2807 domain-containing protein [Mucilaginibacter sp. L3T2-6]|uniref:GIN domain-containing protein n=1 Tax=Mucilaginibacter sp. L3T2-6 TaxID=3062491 RepID=UPI002676284B|nr:DUF2807 domain-containing protein [Mucilaginibacter sp. L3T2-6]MDO3643428.1 DUF2807 domain-containing protein [Mucilaginibacter sp. L3T2-6]MDV6215639.1 DUF2807 domain-containing protein [Mucilaginibacter sp. L3T2-6]
MKTAIITVFTALSLTAGIANSTKAATLKGDANTYTVLTDISAINKIEIHGNVELYVSDGASDQVKVYNKYYSESALVQSTNGVLRISSYKPEKLVVWVSANDLRAISAYDNAEVKSFGNISKIEFAVDLHDNAAAKLDLNAFAASLTVKDNAKADLTGSADQLNLYRDIESNVKSNNFSAAHYLENKITVAGNDLAGL